MDFRNTKLEVAWNAYLRVPLCTPHSNSCKLPLLPSGYDVLPSLLKISISKPSETSYKIIVSRSTRR